MSDTKKTTPATEAEELKSLVLEQADRIAALESKIAASSGKAATAEPEPLKTPTTKFKVGSKSYQFTVPKFILPERGAVTAEAALKDKVILEHLVSIKSGIIKEA
jgi:hypothetical protein